MEENCQQVLLIGACRIQCWCVIVLVHKCLFNHPLLLSGVGSPGRRGARLFATERRGERIEYFVIVQSEGDSLYISILYICDENAFFVWHYLLPVLWFNIQCFSVANIYLVCVFIFLILSLVISCIFVFLLFVPPFFRSLHGLLLWSSDEVTQLTLCIRLVL